MNTITITKGFTNTKRFVVTFPNGNPQRFSFKGQAIKFAEDNKKEGQIVEDKTPAPIKKIKFGHNWQ